MPGSRLRSGFDMDASLGVERKEIDDSPKPGLYLPADDE